LAKNPDDRFPEGSSFLQSLQEAGRAGSSVTFSETRMAEAPGEESGPMEMSEVSQDADGASSEAAVSSGRKVRGHFLALKLAAAALLSLLVFGGSISWFFRPAHLKLDARSSIETGRLSLLLDGQEVYSRPLSAPRQGNRAVGKLLGRDRESFQDWINVSPGRHEVAARVLSDEAGPDFHDSIVVDLKAGETRTLRMVAGRSFGAPLSLSLD